MSIWLKIIKLIEQVPAEELARLPVDGAERASEMSEQDGQEWHAVFHEHDKPELSWWSVDKRRSPLPQFHMGDEGCATSLAVLLNAQSAQIKQLQAEIEKMGRRLWQADADYMKLEPKLAAAERELIECGLALKKGKPSEFKSSLAQSIAALTEALERIAKHCDPSHPDWTQDHLGIAAIARAALARYDAIKNKEKKHV